MKKNDIFLFGIPFFVLEIFMFLYYANEESDDVIKSSLKGEDHSKKYIFFVITYKKFLLS